MITLRIDRDHLRLVCTEESAIGSPERLGEDQETGVQARRDRPGWWRAFSRSVAGQPLESYTR